MLAQKIVIDENKNQGNNVYRAVISSKKLNLEMKNYLRALISKYGFKLNLKITILDSMQLEKVIEDYISKKFNKFVEYAHKVKEAPVDIIINEMLQEFRLNVRDFEKKAAASHINVVKIMNSDLANEHKFNLSELVKFDLFQTN